MSPPLVLLPPSEGKASGGRGRWSVDAGDFGALGPERQAVVDALGRIDRHDEAVAAKVFGVRGDLARRAAEASDALVEGWAPSLPAWRRFTGVVWEHLDPATLAAPVRRRVLVPSGLLGLCRATDPVPDFRLKLSVSLPDIGRLDRFWRPKLVDALARTRGTVVDLLPNEHAAAVDLGHLGTRVLSVTFVDAGGAAIGHDAKAVKGELARALLLHGIDALDKFAWKGWTAEREADRVVVRRDSIN
jgi:cytoplasmic iron level regulating protein YaaA (DUF328/UPF0246 family)